ncbi:condensation domain-containing protein [Streptomyces kaniharaensis]|uniref:condensation domain-containing protein n=1 Tax=Streptomyces kaniharaensis TaxID=212423 RepID=UPI0018A88183|nr:condensation domain-containing protein [Streptomyces kaniharaensis]
MPHTQVAAPVPPSGDGTGRFPLSSQQELWCAGEQSGSFGPRFTVTKALRITGPVDVAALQGALDDVVARHEVLRTVIVRDARPPYQEVHPPSRVPLHVRDLPPAEGQDRELMAQHLLAETESVVLPVEDLPLLRAFLTRFDDRDAVLGLASHHTAADGWSLQLINRDLATCYAARTRGAEPELPQLRQYREYTQWQSENAAGASAAENLAYWRKRLDGAPFFTLPTDRPIPPEHTEPYVAHTFRFDTATMDAVSALGRAARCSRFMVMLAAFSVLARRIGGVDDPVVNTIVHGRGRPEYQDTVGPFLNFLALRTDLADAGTFRELLLATRTTCLEAYRHEVPIQWVEQAVPSLMAPMADPRNCDFIFGFSESLAASPGAGDPFLISESTVPVAKRESVTEQIPGGAAWNMGVTASGEVSGTLQFNPEEFDAGTAAGWVEAYRSIVLGVLADPDRDWRTL